MGMNSGSALAAFLGGRLGAPKPASLPGAYETRRV
jgi:hypothetical protein